MPPLPSEIHAEDIRVGMTAEYVRQVCEADVLGFAETSGDWNPLHVDADYAAGTNYGRRIAHGAFQVGLASAMIGMHLPGRSVLLTSLQAKFPSPLRFPTEVGVHGEVVGWNRDRAAGRLRVAIVDRATGTTTADVAMGFTLHGQRADAAVEVRHSSVETHSRGLPVVMVTGASGGLGAELIRALVDQYDVVAVVRSGNAGGHLTVDNQHVRVVRADLLEQGAVAELESVIDGGLYGVIHCAWPGLPRGGLLTLPAEAVQQQLNCGTVTLVELAKLLMRHSNERGGRLIALGSIAGSQRPAPQTAAYSLGKSALEQTVRLLAAETAGAGITVNALCPTYIPVGMNGHADARRQKLEAAQIPMGRLCMPNDVINAVRWLLAPQSDFVSGQTVGLTGAQL